MLKPYDIVLFLILSITIFLVLLMSGCAPKPAPVLVPVSSSGALPICTKTAPIWSERWIECKDCTPPFRIQAPVRLQTGIKCVKFAEPEEAKE